MGVKLKDIIEPKKIDFKDLEGMENILGKHNLPKL